MLPFNRKPKEQYLLIYEKKAGLRRGKSYVIFKKFEINYMALWTEKVLRPSENVSLEARSLK